MAKQTKILSIGVQAAGLKKWFPEGRMLDCKGKLVWQCYLTPTPLSRSYKIQVEYRLGNAPRVRVVEPKLERSPQGKLPHVYSVEEQRLCLYYPPERQWTKEQHLSLTVVVWAAEWLYYYEKWLITKKWLGGGTHDHDMNEPRQIPAHSDMDSD